jgi:hypothetical protein
MRGELIDKIRAYRRERNEGKKHAEALAEAGIVPKAWSIVPKLGTVRVVELRNGHGGVEVVMEHKRTHSVTRSFWLVNLTKCLRGRFDGKGNLRYGKWRS